MIPPPEEKHLPSHNGTASLQGRANSARKHCERELSSDEITPREAAVTGQLNQFDARLRKDRLRALSEVFPGCFGANIPLASSRDLLVAASRIRQTLRIGATKK